MTARMQPLTVKQMATQAHVSERLVAQAIRVHRYGVPELLPLVHPPHSASIAELLLMTDHLLPETQRAWAAMQPDDFHRATRNLRREIAGTALVQPATGIPPEASREASGIQVTYADSEVERLRARIAELEAEVARLGGAS